MKQTKLLLLFALMLSAVNIWADEETTDKVLLSELAVEPGISGYGEDVSFFTISLQGSEVLYTAYQIDITMPDGLSVVFAEGVPSVFMANEDYAFDGNDIYPFTKGGFGKKTYSHSLVSSVNGNVLRIICSSNLNKTLTSASGALCHVIVQASPYLKPGNVEIGVKALLVTPDEVKYYPQEYTSTSVHASSTSTLSLKVSATNKFGTCILPFSYDLPADGSLQAYTCEAYTNDAILLTRAQRMEAYQPYILYSQDGFSGTLSGTVDASGYPEGGISRQGHLVGTLVQTELIGTTTYVMQNQGSGVMFHQVGETPFVVPAGKCYVELPDGASARAIRISGDETGIQEAENGELEMENKEIFDLSGRLVQKLQKGVYIVNGNKVVIQ